MTIRIHLIAVHMPPKEHKRERTKRGYQMHGDPAHREAKGLTHNDDEQISGRLSWDHTSRPA